MSRRCLSPAFFGRKKLDFQLWFKRLMQRRIKPCKRSKHKRIYWPEREGANYKVLPWAFRNGRY